MSRSNNTKRLKFRMQDSEDFNWNAEKIHNRERLVGVGQGGTKRIKRATHKRNRKRMEPLTKMSGHGWGVDNYRSAFSD